MPERSPAKIAANNFVRQWEDIGGDVLRAVDRVGRSGWLILGEEVSRFEAELAEWWGVPHAVGVASGLDALEIALRCAGISTGDRVLTTPLTAFATTLAILRSGAEPVWCDVDDTGGLDLDLAGGILEADPSIRALMPVHLYGHPLDPVALRRLVDEYGVRLIEDCAQSAGAARDGAPTATVGEAAATSLYPTKNLGALGDGGVLFTDDPNLASKAKVLRDYGQQSRYEHREVGLNSRLDEIHAAILRSAMLPRLDGWLARRKEIASLYEDALADSRLRPVRPAGGQSAHHLFPIEIIDGDPAEVAAHLERSDIVVGRHYPFLCPAQRAVNDIGIVIGTLAVAQRIANRELSLPIHPYLDDDEVGIVIETCLEVSA